MSIFEWKTTNCVGLKEIDEQHKELFSIADELRIAIKDGKSNEIISGSVYRLFEYTQYHFSLEEKLMAEDNYPNFEMHKNQHQKLMVRVKELQKDIVPDDFRSSLLVLELLIQWIQNHILEDDRNYANFVLANKKI